jgi:hypothetical protein
LLFFSFSCLLVPYFREFQFTALTLLLLLL